MGRGVGLSVGEGGSVGSGSCVGSGSLVGCDGREDPPPPGCGVFVGGGNVDVGEGTKTCVGTGVGDGCAAAVARMERRLSSIRSSVVSWVVGVGLAVGLEVGKGVAVGVLVEVAVIVARTVGVGVAVAVGAPLPLALPASNETIVAREMSKAAARPIPTRRSDRNLVMILHGRNQFEAEGSGSSVVSIADGAMSSVFTWMGRGEPNSAWCISAMLWNR